MIKNPLLETYWIKSPSSPWLGFGVTAFSREDAFQLLEEAGYPLSADPNVHVTEGIRLSDLDQNHIAPNTGPLLFRGVWYPQANL